MDTKILVVVGEIMGDRAIHLYGPADAEGKRPMLGWWQDSDPKNKDATIWVAETIKALIPYSGMTVHALPHYLVWWNNIKTIQTLLSKEDLDRLNWK